MKVWIEPNVVVRWWNPLTWIAKLVCHREWFVMIERGYNIYCLGVYRSKRLAELAAKAAKEKT